MGIIKRFASEDYVKSEIQTELVAKVNSLEADMLLLTQ